MYKILLGKYLFSICYARYSTILLDVYLSLHSFKLFNLNVKINIKIIINIYYIANGSCFIVYFVSLSLCIYNQNSLTYIQVYPTVFTYVQFTHIKQYILYSKSRLCDCLCHRKYYCPAQIC